MAATYALSTDTAYWGEDVSPDVATRAAEIGKADIKEAFADEEVEVDLVSGDDRPSGDDELVQRVFDYVQDNWVDWLSQADAEHARDTSERR